MSKFEVTFAELDACYEAGRCSFAPSDNGWGRGQRPVMNVSWHDIQQYITWLSTKTGIPYRLLTEAEWEYAACGTTKPATRRPYNSWAADVGVANNRPAADVAHPYYSWGDDLTPSLADLFIRAFAQSITARYFSSNPSDSGSLRTPCPPASKPAGRRGITPAFGYSAPHPSTGRTSTLLIHALPGAHYGGV